MDLKLTTMNGLIARLALESDLPEIIDLLADDEIGQNVNILTWLCQLNIMPLLQPLRLIKTPSGCV